MSDTAITPATPAADERIPTEHGDLIDYLRKAPHGQNHEIAERLAAQTGNSDEAYAAVDRALEQIDNEDTIDRLRGELAKELGEALGRVYAAERAFHELSGNRVYDVEYAEGGYAASDLLAHLQTAGRALRDAQRANPCPPAPKGSDQ